MSSSNSEQSKETTNSNLNPPPYVMGLCNCGCNGELKPRFNKDGTLRRYIKNHQLKSATRVPRGPGKHNKSSTKSQNKKINELTKAVKDLKSNIEILKSFIISQSRPPAPLESRPVQPQSQPPIYQLTNKQLELQNLLEKLVEENKTLREQIQGLEYHLDFNKAVSKASTTQTKLDGSDNNNNNRQTPLF